MAPVPEPKPTPALLAEPVAQPVAVALAPVPEPVAPVVVIAPPSAIVAAPAVEQPATEDHLVSLFDKLADLFGGADDAATEAATEANAAPSPTPETAPGASSDEIAAWFSEIASLFEPGEAAARARTLPASPR